MVEEGGLGFAVIFSEQPITNVGFDAGNKYVP